LRKPPELAGGVCSLEPIDLLHYGAALPKIDDPIDGMLYMLHADAVVLAVALSSWEARQPKVADDIARSAEGFARRICAVQWLLRIADEPKPRAAKVKDGGQDDAEEP
jgi:hypothetical protein